MFGSIYVNFDPIRFRSVMILCSISSKIHFLQIPVMLGFLISLSSFLYLDLPEGFRSRCFRTRSVDLFMSILLINVVINFWYFCVFDVNGLGN